MDELRILIARLGWPSTSARWWTMQELASRLNEPGSMSKTESALLQLLSTRELEAEVIEVLCIFWMAAKAYGYSPTLKLAESIRRSSILSDLLLESFNMLAEGDDEGLEEVPEEFEIPKTLTACKVQICPGSFGLPWASSRTVLGFHSSGRWLLNGRRIDPPTRTPRSKEIPWHFSRP